MSSRWEQMSARERSLAMVTALLGAALLLVFVLRAALDTVYRLDSEIYATEQHLLHLHAQEIHRDSVEGVFRNITQRRATDLSEAQMHDLLRRELFAASLRDPGMAADPDARPGRRDYLVRIPSMEEGTLRGEGEDFREYQIRVRIPAASIQDLLTFLQRIESSEHLLRIDAMEITRDPHSAHVGALLEVTRTIVARPSAGDVSEPGELHNG